MAILLPSIAITIITATLFWPKLKLRQSVSFDMPPTSVNTARFLWPVAEQINGVLLCLLIQ